MIAPLNCRAGKLCFRTARHRGPGRSNSSDDWSTWCLDYKHPLEEVLIWKQFMGWEIPSVKGCWCDSLMGSHGEGVGRTFPHSPRSSCHGNDQLPITCMHAHPRLAAHSYGVLCLQGKNYNPCLAQKGSTPLPGSFHSCQTINRVIFPALLRAVGREGQNLHHW